MAETQKERAVLEEKINNLEAKKDELKFKFE